MKMFELNYLQTNHSTSVWIVFFKRDILLQAIDDLIKNMPDDEVIEVCEKKDLVEFLKEIRCDVVDGRDLNFAEVLSGKYGIEIKSNTVFKDDMSLVTFDTKTNDIAYEALYVLYRYIVKNYNDTEYLDLSLYITC